MQERIKAFPGVRYSAFKIVIAPVFGKAEFCLWISPSNIDLPGLRERLPFGHVLDEPLQVALDGYAFRQTSRTYADLQRVIPIVFARHQKPRIEFEAERTND
jgi:hypothetical protein